jgi:hypothetical protein
MMDISQIVHTMLSLMLLQNNNNLFNAHFKRKKTRGKQARRDDAVRVVDDS